MKLNRISSDDRSLNEIKAIVTEVHKGMFRVLCKHGEISAKLKGTFYQRNDVYDHVPVVGDDVWIIYNENGTSYITEIGERRSFFARTDFSGHAAGYVKTMKKQVLAANFDTVFILASMNKEFNLKRIERYLATALSSKAEAVILLTKSDLVDDAKGYIDLVAAQFGSIPCYAISSKTGYGFDALNKYLKKDEIIVFLGSSGVGKSSLVNRLVSNDIMSVSEIREKDSRGRHTTSHRQLIRLACGAMIMDTPGIRELGLWDADKGLEELFSDIEEWVRLCRFRDCTHQHEPGCVIRKKLSDGTLSEQRWQRYVSLRKENEWGKLKASPVKR